MPNLTAIFLALCVAGRVQALPQTLLQAVGERIRVEANTSNPVLTSQQSCAPDVLVNSPEFRTTYPQGLFVMCDVHAVGNHASATVFRYIFHASLDKPLVASQTDVQRQRSGNMWRVVSWLEKTIDYARC